ncbi:MAG: HK97 family phage prohead protease, partial [Saprospiraceae bacterium]
MDKIKIKDSLNVRAMFTPDTLTESERTVEVVFGSDAPVRINTWDGPMLESLSFDRSAVNLERLNNGAPLLDNHNRYGSIADIVGVVERAWTDGKKGYAKVRFSKSEKGTRAMEEVKDGILRNISVGYRVNKYERKAGTNPGEMGSIRAVDWEPYEISLVPVPADRNAMVRGEGEQSEISVTTIITNDRQMENNPIQPESPATPPPVVSSATPEQVRSEAIAAERARVTGIQHAVRAAKLPGDFAEKLIADGTQIDNARALIIDEWAKQAAQIETRSQQSQPTASVGRDNEAEGRIEAISDALFLRAEPMLAEKELKANPERRRAAEKYKGMTLLDHCRESVERSGASTRGMDKMEIAKRSITSSTSDFPVLLEGTNRRVLLAAYSSMGDTWRRFCNVGSVGDFREYKRLRTGSFSNLEALQENGTYKTPAIPDGEFERITAGTKGNVINVTRKMIVNDDLSAFTRLASMLGRAAARTIESDVFALFALNSGNGPTMQDGNPLFHATHSNIAATNAKPTVDAFDAARVQLATQKDPSGNDFLDLRPALWLGPIGLGGQARVTNENQY